MAGNDLSAGLHRGSDNQKSAAVPRPLDKPDLYCHCDAMTTTKDDRLQIRVEPKAKHLLEEAAAASHLTVSAFVLQAAEMRADQVLLDRETIRLSPRAAATFANALAEPATVNERLAKALVRPRGFTWAD